VKEKLGKIRARRGTEGTIANVADKAFQLLQVGLGRIPVDSFAAGMQIHQLKTEVR